jgi:hypothetical protein
VKDFYLQKSAKDYYDYKEGSYWIFRDSLSGDIDSFSVVQYEDEMIYEHEGRNGDPARREQLSIWILEFSSDTAKGRMYFRFDLSMDYGTRLVYWARPVDSSLDMFTSNETSYATVEGPCGDSLYVGAQQYPIMYLDSVPYYEVHEHSEKIVVNGCPGMASRNDHFFLNKDVGLVKISLNDYYANRVWKLLKYNIIR